MVKLSLCPIGTGGGILHIFAEFVQLLYNKQLPLPDLKGNRKTAVLFHQPGEKLKALLPARSICQNQIGLLLMVKIHELVGILIRGIPYIVGI